MRNDTKFLYDPALLVEESRQFKSCGMETYLFFVPSAMLSAFRAKQGQARGMPLCDHAWPHIAWPRSTQGTMTMHVAFAEFLFCGTFCNRTDSVDECCFLESKLMSFAVDARCGMRVVGDNLCARAIVVP